MRQTLLLIATIAACACASSPAPAPTPALPPQPPVLATEKINEELIVRQLDPHTWIVTHTTPYPANSLVVEADDGSVMLVDTPWTPDATKVMLDWFEAKLGKRRFNAFITHFHLDALGGAPELKRRGIGARAHGAIEDLLAERGAARRQSLVDSLADRPELAQKFATAEMLRPPSLYVAGKFGLPLGMKERYTLLNPAPSHSPDLTVVMLEERGILFGSCAVRGGDSLGPLDDADLAGWRTAIEELKALNPRVVVPGHGDRLDPQLLDHTLALLDRAQAQAP